MNRESNVASQVHAVSSGTKASGGPSVKEEYVVGIIQIGDFKKTELFEKLPKRMIGSFNVILKYLYDNNRILIDREGYLIYTWNPELIKKLINQKIF